VAEVGPEGEQIEGEEEGDGPLDDGRGVLVRAAVEEGAECDGEGNEDGGVDRFEDVRSAEGAERAAKRFIKPSELDDGEDGAKRGAGDEHEKEAAVHGGVVFGIEYREEDEADAADEGRDDRQRRHYFFARAHIREQPSLMPRPPLDRQAQEEAHRSDDTPDNEERLEDVGSNIGDVRDGLVGGHGNVVRTVLGEPRDQQREDGAEPHRGGGQRDPDVPPVVVVAVRAHQEGAGVLEVLRRYEAVVVERTDGAGEVVSHNVA